MGPADLTDDGAEIDARKALGFYSWNVQDNRVFGDEVLAYAFDLNQDEFAIGIPVERVLSRVIEQDRQVLAKAIHEAILNGLTFSHTYRIIRDDESMVHVQANGRCLRDANNVPSIFAGTVLVGPGQFEADEAYDPLETYCRAALGLATYRHQDLAARYISSALGVLRGDTA